MKWAKDLFPIDRSLTGAGTLKTFKYIKNINPNFKLKFFNSKEKVFDWMIPLEWNVKKAYIITPSGKIICNYDENNLHLVNYSTKVNKIISYNQLKKKIHFIKEKPSAIPYVTSYYKKTWGFCISFNEFKKLTKKGNYQVVIETNFKKGKMGYLEYLIPGKSKKEILISTYSCHPSMANNELSGPLILIYLSLILSKSYYSIRFLIAPETIGSIAYISKNFKKLKENMIAGYNLSCLAKGKKISLIESRRKNLYPEEIFKRVFKKREYKIFNFKHRGSNERQFDCQNVNLPLVTLTRDRFEDFPEYHTSLDNLDILSIKNLKQGINKILKIINEIQNNKIYVKTTYCEPFLSKYNLYNSKNFFHSSKYKKNKRLLDLIAYCDKDIDTKQLRKLSNLNYRDFTNTVNILLRKKIIKQL